MRVAVALWSALVLSVSTLPLAGGYRSPWALPVLALAPLVPVGLVALGRRLAVPTWVIATAGTSLALVPAMLVLDTADPVQTGWRSSPAFTALGPLIDAVPRLLTAPRPAPPGAAYLVPAVLVVYLTALVVALVVVGRRRAGAAPLIGAVVLHTAGALLTAGQADRQGIAVLLTALVLLLGWAWLPATQTATARTTRAAQSPDRDAPARSEAGAREVGAQPTTAPQVAARRGLPVVPTITVAVVATFAFAAVIVPTERSFEPRALVPPPALPAAANNPIPDLTVWTARADQALFTVQSGDGGPLPRRFRLAALPDFDGAAWRIDARLRAVGVVDEPDLPPGLRQRELTYVVQPEDLRGVWLPSVGRAATVSSDALMDVHTGALVLPGGLDAQTVSVVAQVDEPTTVDLARAAVPPAADAARYLELPRVPQELRAEALEIVEGIDSRWDQAEALSEAVRGERLLDHRAPSGSSYGRIQEFLFAEADDGGQVGSTEQFAAAFAVLGRAAGLPTRMVVGFDLGADADLDGGGPLSVRGGHARAWAEVYFSRVGWVPFDPSPDVVTEVDRPDEVPEAGSEEPAPTPTPTPEQTPTSTEAPQEEAQEASGALLVTLAAVLLAVLVLAVLVGAVLATRRRLRWRRAGAPGAWALILRAMDVAGRPAPPDKAAPQVAGALDPPAREAAALVAAHAERSVFAPAEPPVHGAAEPAQPHPAGTSSDAGDAPGTADHWALAAQVERHLRRQAPWWRRLGWWIWPR